MSYDGLGVITFAWYKIKLFINLLRQCPFDTSLQQVQPLSSIAL